MKRHLRWAEITAVARRVAGLFDDPSLDLKSLRAIVYGLDLAISLTRGEQSSGSSGNR